MKCGDKVVWKDRYVWVTAASGKGHPGQVRATYPQQFPWGLEWVSTWLDRAELSEAIGYARIHLPGHPESNTWGWVYEHRVVAEQSIGRCLEKGEVVHHINGIRHDNRPNNLQVMKTTEP